MASVPPPPQDTTIFPAQNDMFQVSVYPPWYERGGKRQALKQFMERYEHSLTLSHV
jgi:hypothetical protein